MKTVDILHYWDTVHLVRRDAVCHGLYVYSGWGEGFLLAANIYFFHLYLVHSDSNSPRIRLTLAPLEAPEYLHDTKPCPFLLILS